MRAGHWLRGERDAMMAGRRNGRCPGRALNSKARCGSCFSLSVSLSLFLLFAFSKPLSVFLSFSPFAVLVAASFIRWAPVSEKLGPIYKESVHFSVAHLSGHLTTR